LDGNGKENEEENNPTRAQKISYKEEKRDTHNHISHTHSKHSLRNHVVLFVVLKNQIIK